MKFLKRFKIPNFVTELGTEFGAEYAVELLKGKAKTYDTASKKRRETGSSIGQKQKNGFLLREISQIDESRRNVFNDRLRMSALGVIPERHGIVHKISQDELVESLTCIPEDAGGSRVDMLEWLADASEDEFWVYIDVLWPYKSLEEIKANFSRGINAIGEGIGISAGSIDNVAEELATPLLGLLLQWDAILTRGGY